MNTHAQSVTPSLSSRNFYLQILTTLAVVAFLGTAQGQYSPPTTGLVGWWRAEGNAADSFGANHGVALNGLSYGAGASGQAFSLDGQNDHVRITATPSLDVGAGNGFSIGMWIKPSTLNQQNLIEWNNSLGFIGVHMTLSAPYLGGGAGSLWANLVDTGGNHHQISSTTGLISTDTFQHVALTFDKPTGLGRLFINGSVVASANLGSFTPYTSSDLFFGIRPSGPFTPLSYSQYMDEVTIYNRALSAGEVVSLATVPEPTAGALIAISMLAFRMVRRSCRGSFNAGDSGQN